MVGALRGVFGAASDEDASIVGLNAAEADGDVEVDREQLTGLLVLIHVVERNHSLVKLEEVNAVRHPRLVHLAEAFHLGVVHLPLNQGLIRCLLLLTQEVINAPSLIDG